MIPVFLAEKTAQWAVLSHQPNVPFCDLCSIQMNQCAAFSFWYAALQHRQRIAEGFFPGSYAVRQASGSAPLFGGPGRGEAIDVCRRSIRKAGSSLPKQPVQHIGLPDAVVGNRRVVVHRQQGFGVVIGDRIQWRQLPL